MTTVRPACRDSRSLVAAAGRSPWRSARRLLGAVSTLFARTGSGAYEVVPEAGTTMDRWVSRSSSGRLTSARSRCSWSAISTCSSANRGSSFPIASTSIASSVTSSSVDRRSSREPWGRSTISSVCSRASIRSEGASRPRSSARSRYDARSRGSSWETLALPRRQRASRTRCCRRSVSSSRHSSTWTRSIASCSSSSSLTATSSLRSACRIATAYADSPSSVSAATLTPGLARRSSRTASRT